MLLLQRHLVYLLLSVLATWLPPPVKNINKFNGGGPWEGEKGCWRV